MQLIEQLATTPVRRGPGGRRRPGPRRHALQRHPEPGRARRRHARERQRFRPQPRLHDPVAVGDRASVSIMQKWLPPEMLDLHGYVTPTLIEATTKPHNPSIDYDLWLKWNQPRIDANEAAMAPRGYDVTRPVNDWCSDAELPPRERHLPGRRRARTGRGRGLGRLGTVLHPDVRPARRPRRLDGRDVQLEREPAAAAGPAPGRASRRLQYVGELVDDQVRPREPRRHAARRARELPPRRRRRAATRVLPAAVRRRQQLDARVSRRPTSSRAAPASAASPRRTGWSSGCCSTASWSTSSSRTTRSPARPSRKGSYVVLDDPGPPRPGRHGAARRRRHLRRHLDPLRAAGGMEPRLPVGRRRRDDPARRDVRPARRTWIQAPTSCPAASSRASPTGYALALDSPTAVRTLNA